MDNATTKDIQESGPLTNLLSFKDFISGSFSGVVAVFIGQPFDLVKIKMQTKNNYKSSIECLKHVYNNEGIKGIYKGTLSPLLGVSFAFAVQFSANQFAKNYFIRKNRLKNNPTTNLKVPYYFFSGMFAGLLNSFIAAPMELFRIKMQIQEKDQNCIYKNTIDCIKKVYKYEGLRGVYQGYFVTLGRELLSLSLFFGIYESMMKDSEEIYGTRDDIPNLQIMFNGALDGLIVWTIIYPSDVIKSHVQAYGDENKNYKTMKSTFVTIYKERGLRGFFKGLAPCLIRAFPVSAASFFAFEICKRFLFTLNL